MSNLRILTAAEQVANHLREELAREVWTGTMPGGAALARELGVGRMTVDAALELLEKEGYLQAQGGRRRRLIRQSVQSVHASGSLKVAILPLLKEDFRFDYIMDMQRCLHEEGHTVLFTRKAISDLAGDSGR